jgi:nitroreductase
MAMDQHGRRGRLAVGEHCVDVGGDEAGKILQGTVQRDDLAEARTADGEIPAVTALRAEDRELPLAYLILAARSLGLDCGPMSGFDQAKVDEEFFAAGKPCFGCDQEFFAEGHVRTNFLCNLGYGDSSALHPRLPRLAFTEACSLL